MDFTVEDDIPIPPKVTAGPLTVAIRTLKVGQSLFVPDELVKKYTNFRSVVFSAGSNAPHHMHTTVRKVEGGYRIWRTE